MAEVKTLTDVCVPVCGVDFRNHKPSTSPLTLTGLTTEEFIRFFQHTTDPVLSRAIELLEELSSLQMEIE